MTVTDIVRRLNEACTGGRDCQCTYRVAADEILAMRKAMDGPNLAWDRQSATNVKLVDQIAVMTTEIDKLRAEIAEMKDAASEQACEIATLRDIDESRKLEAAELRAENAALRKALDLTRFDTEVVSRE